MTSDFASPTFARSEKISPLRASAKVRASLEPPLHLLQGCQVRQAGPLRQELQLPLLQGCQGFQEGLLRRRQVRQEVSRRPRQAHLPFRTEVRLTGGAFR